MIYAFDTDHSVIIPADGVNLEGILHVPAQAKGLVIFAHGSGSSRFSKRNQYIAAQLQQVNIATLLFDLLTLEQDARDARTMEFRFNIELLATRLLAATNWILPLSQQQKLALGYFGASTGGGAALLAAAQVPHLIKAVVSRGGRPDLAGEALAHVRAATLLLVGGDDEAVLKLNELAFEKLCCTKALTIIPDATHLFEEPGKLEEVARLATHWFTQYLHLE